MRRKFDEALKAVAPEDRVGSMAVEGLEYCNRLFHLEKELAELSTKEKYEQRLEKSKPLADAFYGWLISGTAPTVLEHYIRITIICYIYYIVRLLCLGQCIIFRKTIKIVARLCMYIKK